MDHTRGKSWPTNRLRLADLWLHSRSPPISAWQPDKLVRSYVLAVGLARATDLSESGVRAAFFASLVRPWDARPRPHSRPDSEARLSGGDELVSRRAAAAADFGNRREVLALTLGTGRGAGAPTV